MSIPKLYWAIQGPSKDNPKAIQGQSKGHTMAIQGLSKGVGSGGVRMVKQEDLVSNQSKRRECPAIHLPPMCHDAQQLWMNSSQLPMLNAALAWQPGNEIVGGC